MGKSGELRNSWAARALWKRVVGGGSGCSGFLERATEVKAPGRSSGGGLLEAVTEMLSSWGEPGRDVAGLVVLCARIVVVSVVKSVENGKNIYFSKGTKHR